MTYLETGILVIPVRGLTPGLYFLQELRPFCSCVGNGIRQDQSLGLSALVLPCGFSTEAECTALTSQGAGRRGER